MALNKLLMLLGHQFTSLKKLDNTLFRVEVRFKDNGWVGRKTSFPLTAPLAFFISSGNFTFSVQNLFLASPSASFMRAEFDELKNSSIKNTLISNLGSGEGAEKTPPGTCLKGNRVSFWSPLG